MANTRSPASNGASGASGETTAAGNTAADQLAQTPAPVQLASVEIGRVESLNGSVFAIHPDGVRAPLAPGATVYQRDEIETSSEGGVALVFLDGTKFSLGGDARMVLDEMIYNPGAKSGSSVMSVLKGSFVFITGEVATVAPDAMKVKTPGGTLGIRGTTVGCSVGGAEDSCVLLPSPDGSGGHSFTYIPAAGGEAVVIDEEYLAVIVGNTGIRKARFTASELKGLLGSGVLGFTSLSFLTLGASEPAAGQGEGAVGNNGHFSDRFGLFGSFGRGGGGGQSGTALGPVESSELPISTGETGSNHLFIPSITVGFRDGSNGGLTNVTVSEGGIATFTVTLSEPSSAPVTVSF